MPLPIVDPEIAYPFAHDLSNLDEKVISEMMKSLNEKNPAVLRFITAFSDYYSKRGHDFGIIALGMLLVYRLLETQQEVDDLER